MFASLHFAISLDSQAADVDHYRYLQITPDHCKKINLQRLHVMARDEKTRIILYQNEDASVKVTHISTFCQSYIDLACFRPADQLPVQYGCIPWTRTKTSRTVSFLNPHTVTVIDDEGHHIYQIDPKYKFKDNGACCKFQTTIRERELLGAFDAISVTVDGDTISYEQVIKLWSKTGRSAAVTLTYLETATGNGCGHKELNLEKYHQLPLFVHPAFSLQRNTDPSAIVELSSNTARKPHRIKFKSVADAKEFQEFFVQNHPFNKQIFESLHSSTTPQPGSTDVMDISGSLTPQPSLTYGSSVASASSMGPISTPLDISDYRGKEPPPAIKFDLDSESIDWKPVFTAAGTVPDPKSESQVNVIRRKPVNRRESENEAA